MCCFFNDPATTEIYTLSLHDALPILWRWCSSASKTRIGCRCSVVCDRGSLGLRRTDDEHGGDDRAGTGSDRSEEHTSELQSQSNLVCRLLLEKKKHRLARSREAGETN